MEKRMETKRRLGRPKKADHEKARYQRIAVHEKDYLKLVEHLEKTGEELVDAFAKMVALYTD